MNLLDIIVIIILAYCLTRGIFRGIIRELSSIIGVLTGFYAAYTYYPMATKWMGSWLVETKHIEIISFFLIFLVVFAIISIVGIIIKYVLNIAFLGWIDRICGFFFGALKGILIVTVLLIGLTAFLPQGDPLVKNSVIYPHLTIISENVALVITNDLKRQYGSKIRVLKKEWKIQ
ncbi:MAG: CvpA family protein [Desulfobacteraceae bacterium]|nr:CvpA family protein [Desulfobacteraceae bacterium]